MEKRAVKPTLPPRLEGHKARVAARAIADNRRHRRVNLPVEGRVLHENGREWRCALTSISVGGLSAHTDLTPRINSHVVVLIQDIGRVQGRVTRVSGSTFAMAFDRFSDRKRTKLADELAWLLNGEKLGLHEDRRSVRHTRSDFARVRIGDGYRVRRAYIDASQTGASFEMAGRVTLGEHADIEARPARITRIHSRGFAVEFDRSAANTDDNNAAGDDTP